MVYRLISIRMAVLGAVLVLAACRSAPVSPSEAVGSATAVPSAKKTLGPTASLIAPTTATVAPTAPESLTPASQPTPSGALPRLLAQLDLGNEAGDAYGPAALAVDEYGTAYVACQTCDVCDERQGAVVVLDMRAGRVREVWPLPGGMPGPLAVGDGWVYVTYQDDAYASRLVVLDASTGRQRTDVATDWVNPEHGIWLDIGRNRLYLAYIDRLVALDVSTLEQVDVLDLRAFAPGAPIELACDASADRLYVAAGTELYAYEASRLGLLWQVSVPGQRIDGLLPDLASKALLVESIVSQEDAPVSDFYVVSPSGGLGVGARPVFDAGDWDLAWADVNAERVVLQEMVWVEAGGSALRLVACDTSGRLVGTPVTLWGASALARLPHDGSLYALQRNAHALVLVDGATLGVQARLQVGVELRGLAHDPDAGRLYVNDTAGRLYAIDASGIEQGALKPGRSIAAGSGELLLDAEGGHLLVAQAEGDADRVSVVQLAEMRVTQEITGGNKLALDITRGRALVGSAWAGYPNGEGSVQVWDLATGQRVGAIGLGGVPAYNAARDEVYVAGYSGRIYSGQTLVELGSLTPDIDAQECKGCSGQAAVRSVHAFPEHNVLALEMTAIAAGHGPGAYPPPRLFALDSLSPISHALTLLPTSTDGWLAWLPASGQTFESLTYSRYVMRSNLVAWDVSTRERASWWDGVRLECLTPDGRMGFIERDRRWLALDMASMTPLGYLPRYAVQALDTERDLMLAIDGSRVSVLSAVGGFAEQTGRPISAQLRAYPRAIVVSPDYARDRTLFVVGARGLYRSADRGVSWELLRGGLPLLQSRGDPGGTLAVSPDYARDRTLFWGGCDSGSTGMGVWRSEDGGDTWQPVWFGLRHLCVERLELSPAYSADGALAAYCQYADLSGGEWGQSVWVSRDRGETWSLAGSTADLYVQPLPRAEALFGVPMRESPVSPGMGWAGVGTGTGDAYRETLSFSEGEFFVAQALSSAYPEDQALFVLSTQHLYRSEDDGLTWKMARSHTVDVKASDARFAVLAATVGAGGETEVVLLDEAGGLYWVTQGSVRWEPTGQSVR